LLFKVIVLCLDVSLPALSQLSSKTPCKMASYPFLNNQGCFRVLLKLVLLLFLHLFLNPHYTRNWHYLLYLGWWLLLRSEIRSFFRGVEIQKILLVDLIKNFPLGTFRENFFWVISKAQSPILNLLLVVLFNLLKSAYHTILGKLERVSGFFGFNDCDR
jgi:hypothetical protein